jgi:DNA-binding MarR family transcriptional regulator
LRSLRLSATGKRAYRATTEVSLAIERHLQSGLTAAERRELDRLVDKVDQLSQTLPMERSSLR